MPKICLRLNCIQGLCVCHGTQKYQKLVKLVLHGVISIIKLRKHQFLFDTIAYIYAIHGTHTTALCADNNKFHCM